MFPSNTVLCRNTKRSKVNHIGDSSVIAKQTAISAGQRTLPRNEIFTHFP